MNPYLPLGTSGSDIQEVRYEHLKSLLVKSSRFSSLLLSKLEVDKKRGRPTADKKANKKAETSKKSKAQLDEIVLKNVTEEGSKSTKHDTDQNIDHLCDFDVPKLFIGTLREYQKHGMNWMLKLYMNGMNGILADEMGLGKTIQVIALFCSLLENQVLGPFLVIAPLSTLSNWVNETTRFAPHIKAIMFHGDKVNRAALRDQILAADADLKQSVVVTSYDMAMVERRCLARVPWTYMVVDEGHRLKNMNCRLLKEISFYKVQNKLLLTGTPLQNSLNELWSLLHFLMPSIFSDLESFHMWLDQNALMKQEQKREQKRQEQEGVKVKEEPESCEAAEQGSVKSEAEEREEQVLCMVQQILTPFVLRRVKKEVELELPQKRELLVFCPMSALQLNYYKVVSDRTIVSILGHSNHEVDHFDYEKLWRDYGRNRRYTADRVSGNAAKGDFTPLTTHRHSPLHARDDNDEMCRLFKNSKLTNFMALLKRVCNHPFLISNPHAIGDLNWYEDYLDTSGKMQLLDRMLEKLKQRGHKVLLFSQWTSILDIIEDSLSHRNYRYCRIDGNCSLADRQSQIDEFNNGHSDTSAKDHLFLFLLTTRAGGQGINLTAADTVIIFDSDWNPQMDLQAQDRCHRIGQTKRVLVYRLVTEHSVDHVIVQRAEAKRKLERVVLQDGRFDASHRALTRKVLDLGEIRAILEEQEQQHVRLREMKKEGEDLVNDKMLEALLDRDTIFAMSQEEEQCTGLANDSPKLNDKENGTEDPRIKRNSALNEECEIKHGGKRRKTSGNLKNNGKENIEKQQVNSSQESVVQGHKFFQLVSVEGNVHSQKIKEEY